MLSTLFFDVVQTWYRERYQFLYGLLREDTMATVISETSMTKLKNDPDGYSLVKGFIIQLVQSKVINHKSMIFYFLMILYIFDENRIEYYDCLTGIIIIQLGEISTMTQANKNSVHLQAIKEPSNVKVLILAQNKTSIKEFYFIRSYTNLLKVDISYNKLSGFPSGFSFSNFPKLRTLFLHYNKFSSLKNLAVVVESNSIIYLTLFGNPLQEAKARHFFINEMESLMLMDNKIVRLQERNVNVNLREIVAESLSFPIINEASQDNTQLYLSNVIKELHLIRQYYLTVNPIIKLQRWWKRHCRKKNIKWKPMILPQRRQISAYNIKHHKEQIARLTTQKLPICNSNEEKIFALLAMNYQFWKWMKNIVEGSRIFLSKDYCERNNIKYQINNQFKTIKNFQAADANKLKKLKLLSFFVKYHQAIVIKYNNSQSFQLKGKSKGSQKDRAYGRQLIKIYINANRKIINLQQKLIVLESNYQYYVSTQLSKHELQELIRIQYFKYILASHRGQKCIFPVFIEQLNARTRASVTIQRIWRGYKTRKHYDAFQNKREKDAAIKIQKWVRNLKFHHRHKFLLQVAIYLKKQRKSTDIILQTSQLQAIESYCFYKQKFGKYFIINFQECSFSIQKAYNISNHTDINKCSITFNAQRSPYPEYMNLSINFNFDTTRPTIQKSNILQILFKQAKQIEQIVDSKGIKYIRFGYCTCEQALNRKFILALKTYRMINHQFIHSLPLPQVPEQYITNFYNEVNSHKLVTIIYDHLKNEKQEISKNHSLQNKRSVNSLHTQAKDVTKIGEDIHIKIKFFLVTNDYSCTMVLKTPSSMGPKNKKIIQYTDQDRMGMYYLGNKRSISKRYGDDQSRNHIDSISKISRNILSLNELDNSVHSSRKPSLRYPKVLNTDISHSIITSISPDNSLKKLQTFNKMQIYDKFDKQVYPPATEVIRQSLIYRRHLDELQSLRSKRTKIDEIKNSHINRITEIVQQKVQNLNSLRKSIHKQNEQTSKKIEQAKQELEQQKIRKHDRVKEHLKSSTTTFQKQFLKKGIKSIKKQLREYQKKCKSFRYVTNEHQQEPKNQRRQQIRKTELKQFSVNFSEGDNEFKFGFEGVPQKSDISERAKERLKNQISNYNSRENSLGSDMSQIIKIQKNNSLQELKKARAEQRERKTLKKKRLVHSVFPQQFYPLRQSAQIGFQLPKISKN